jgi:hypothetical protein
MDDLRHHFIFHVNSQSGLNWLMDDHRHYFIFHVNSQSGLNWPMDDHHHLGQLHHKILKKKKKKNPGSDS